MRKADRLLLDTIYLQALLNIHDQHHELAKTFVERVKRAQEAWVTEAVLLETANAVRKTSRQGVVDFIRACYSTSNIVVVEMSSNLMMQGLSLYEKRPDKEWSLTDCISFVVMEEKGIQDAVTTDAHFRQAGFNPIMRSE